MASRRECTAFAHSVWKVSSNATTDIDLSLTRSVEIRTYWGNQAKAAELEGQQKLEKQVQETREIVQQELKETQHLSRPLRQLINKSTPPTIPRPRREQAQLSKNIRQTKEFVERQRLNAKLMELRPRRDELKSKKRYKTITPEEMSELESLCTRLQELQKAELERRREIRTQRLMRI